MLTSINPLGERGRGQRYWVTTTFYVVGSVVGGAALGVASGVLGMMLPDGVWRLWAIGLLAVVGVGLELSGFTPPSWHRQVDENWLARYRGWVYGLGFGIQLGFGLVTIVTSVSMYVLVAVMVLSGDLAMSIGAGAVFGLTRSLFVLSVSGVKDPAALRDHMRRLQTRLRVSKTSVSTSMMAVALLAVIGSA